MDTGSFLGRFQGVKARGEGKWVAKCPCHNDKTASLSIDVKAGHDGRRRIMLHDHAGCRTEDILAAIGVDYADLVLDPDPDFGRGRNGGKTCGNGGKRQKAAGESGSQRADQRDGDGQPADRAAAERAGFEVHAAGGSTDGDDSEVRGGAAGGGDRGGHRGAAGGDRGGDPDRAAAAKVKEADPEIDWDNPDRVYSYTDAEGRELFQVVRYHYKNAPGKTFRQRMRATEEMRKDPAVKVDRAGWVHKVPEALRDSALYRLPEALAAIRAGRPVYVVEGEKDVETLARLGHAATCNAGGAGKWRDSQSALLAGADLIILPDNDPRNEKGGYPGQDHALDVALKSHKTACRRRATSATW